MAKSWPPLDGHPDIRKYPLYRVEWADAVSVSGWFDPGEQSGDEAVLSISVGYLVRRNSREITLAQSINVLGHFGDRITIPAGMIKSVRRIRG